MQTYLRDAVLVMLADCAGSSQERERLLHLLASDPTAMRRHLRREAARLRRRCAPQLDSQEASEDVIVEERRLRSAAWMWANLPHARREAILAVAVAAGLEEPAMLKYEIEGEMPEQEEAVTDEYTED